jgi:23S rRNA (guanosine2251-2'-O)-methyltransferase
VRGPTPVITVFHAIEEALKRSRGGRLYLSDRRKRNLLLQALAEERGAAVSEASAAELEQMSGIADHRGAAYVPPEGAAPAAQTDLRGGLASLGAGPRLVLVLDHIEDPHNLGAVFRSADQFGADLVVIPERRAAQITPAVAKASAGASAHVRSVAVANIASSLRTLREAGFWIYGAHLRGTRLDGVRFAGRTALVLGSEGHGLADLVARSCDELVRIPSRGSVDSLNVSVAAGIFLYEIRRSQGCLEDQSRPIPGT